MNFPTLWRQAALRNKRSRAILWTAALGLAPIARADFQLDFVYNPVTGATTVTYFGSWASWAGAVHDSPSISGGISQTGIAHYAGTNDYLVTSVFSGAAIPWNVNTTSNGRSGASWGFTATRVIAPENYTANTVISGSLTFAGLDLTTLGFDAAEIANGGTIGSGNFIVHWTASAIPEPTTWSIWSGLVAMGIVAFRVRRRNAPQPLPFKRPLSAAN